MTGHERWWQGYRPTLRLSRRNVNVVEESGKDPGIDVSVAERGGGNIGKKEERYEMDEVNNRTWKKQKSKNIYTETGVNAAVAGWKVSQMH